MTGQLDLQTLIDRQITLQRLIDERDEHANAIAEFVRKNNIIGARSRAKRWEVAKAAVIAHIQGEGEA